MERRVFLSNVGLSVAGVCAVCLGACSKSGTGGGAPSANFTIDLASSLLNVGDSLVQGGVIIVRLAASNDPTSFSAVQVACTHEGTSINYNTGQGIYICPNHGSRFSTSGMVILGPATKNLKQYNVSISGTSLTVTG